MGWVKRVVRSPRGQAALGALLYRYLRLVQRTTRWTMEPADAYRQIDEVAPFILAMWHGQHLMVPFVKRPGDRVACLVSRAADGELNARALEDFGIRPIRGSGARGRRVARRGKGGAAALRAMLRALADRESIALTADVPKVARRCGEGIVMLARLSGRPIIPMAVVSARRIDFDSWDKASVGKPFGRGAIVVEAPVHVARDADEAALEAARRAVEAGLDRAHQRAYALVGARDPGEGLSQRLPIPEGSPT